MTGPVLLLHIPRYAPDSCPVTITCRIPLLLSSRQISSAVSIRLLSSALFKTTVYTAVSGHPFLPADLDAASRAMSSAVTLSVLFLFSSFSASSGRNTVSSILFPTLSRPYTDRTCVVSGRMTGSWSAFCPVCLYEQGNFQPQDFLKLMIGKPCKLPAGRRRSHPHLT